MSLQSELDAFKATWTERVGPAIAQMMSDDNSALLPLAARALKSGDPFPAATLADQLGRPVDLGSLFADGPMIVTFYRGGWCPYCNLELRAYQKLLPDIERLGARLVAITPETPDNALSTSEKNDLAFTVLSDDHGRLADALGIRFELSDAVKAYFVKAGHDLPARNGDDRWSLPMPATYVVEQGGRIALAHVDPDYRRRAEPSAVMAALQSLGYRTGV
ncbi:MAG: AhpC/TSA family protein [Proteobacteria bacterium]|nr:AhpC/TSA family protein [Pseudomonadota bacterium]